MRRRIVIDADVLRRVQDRTMAINARVEQLLQIRHMSDRAPLYLTFRLFVIGNEYLTMETLRSLFHRQRDRSNFIM